MKHFIQEEAARTLLVDMVIAVVLTLLSWAQLFMSDALMFVIDTGLGSIPGIVEPEITIWFFVLLACCFMPLAFRRRYPHLVFAVTFLFYLVIQMTMRGFALSIIAPLVALYTLASIVRRRDYVIMLIVAVACVLSVDLSAVDPGASILMYVQKIAFLVTAAALGDSIHSRQALAEEAQRRAEEAERSREEVALRRVEEERMRIAREVHDITAHSLSAVIVQAGAAERLIDKDPVRVKEAIHEIRSASKSALEELREMVGVLREPLSEAELAPTAGLDRIGEIVSYLEYSGIEVSLRSELDDVEIPAYLGMAIFRITREAATNIVRHAKAKRVSIDLTHTSSEVRLNITDDGAGKSEDCLWEGVSSSLGVGHGIDGMRERAVALGGTFLASPCSGGGFRVSASLPMVRRAQDE